MTAVRGKAWDFGRFRPAEEPSGWESTGNSSGESGAILNRVFHTHKYSKSCTFENHVLSRAVVSDFQGANVNVLSRRILSTWVFRSAGSWCIQEGVAWRCCGADIIHYHICAV